MLEPGDLILVDGKPAEFGEYLSDNRGDYITYRALHQRAFYALSMDAFSLRAKAVPKYRS